MWIANILLLILLYHTLPKISTAEYFEDAYDESSLIYTFGESVIVNNYQATRERCWESGGRVVEIQTRKHQEVLDKLIDNKTLKLNFFIGLRREDLNEMTSVSKSRHSIQSTTYFDNNFLLIKNGVFSSVFANRKNFFVCMNPGPCHEESLLPSNASCYKRASQKSTWYDARRYCINMGGDLMEFEDEKVPFSHPESFWAGYSKIRWSWESEKGYFAKYTNWDGGYESSGYGDPLTCAELHVDTKQWRETVCRLPYVTNHVVCQKLKPTTSTTTATTTATTTTTTEATTTAEATTILSTQNVHQSTAITTEQKTAMVDDPVRSKVGRSPFIYLIVASAFVVF
ncbi:hypothetical protein HELRODRAFT_179809 [Helobdella robusta]|uniref:C-type lectin domain-containing protein n=1 Tax=Helobdella robusta TaxID=6412 RepID=T1FF64_HELRO|nr:hypothetical protein HELRODRAFT_179809 [Helobdella robusta]ESN94969.1 hypothetical protein HELRODRAFT_179809 [Helobdella robusta]